MSSDNWNTSAERERIINRKKEQEAKRKERAKENPTAFEWEKTDGGKYQCKLEECGCEREYATLVGCIEHIHAETREEGQASLSEW